MPRQRSRRHRVRSSGTMAAVSSWGAGIFASDEAADVRDDYRALLEDKVPGDLATRRVIEGFASSAGSDDPTLWIALAASQHQVGRLEDHVRDRAVEMIDSGDALRSWLEEQGYGGQSDQVAPPPPGVVRRRRA